MLKRWTALSLFALGLTALHAPAQADQLADIQQRGVLRVAVPQDFPPFGSIGPDLKPRGLDIDTAQLMADKLHVKLEVTPVNSTNRIPFLTTGKVDLVVSSLGKNPDREKVIDFSKAYAPFYLGVFGPKDAAISTPEQLAGKTISVTRGSIEDLALTDVAPKDATIKRFEDNNSTIAAYLAGQSDLIASGSVVMKVIGARNPAKEPVLKVKLKDSPVYIGINKNEPALKSEGRRHPRRRPGRRYPEQELREMAGRSPAEGHLRIAAPWRISSTSNRCSRTLTCCSRVPSTPLS
ncbi:polar amino acid transport system substrate-binding protein [Pseudomonas psychrotolerans]|nr:polar amino acid transport system substrate-binding protein [Pseudomonas psychrotolerans]